MRNLKESLQTELRLPTIIGERCVHAHIETASCEACVKACPSAAWILDDESLGLDTSLCDGCGLCVPACSENAIAQSRDYAVREEKGQRFALMGCERSGLAESNCHCLHSITHQDLLSLYRDGLNQMVVTRGDCKNCSRGKTEPLSRRIDQINQMLGHRGARETLHYHELVPDRWRSLFSLPERAAPGPQMTRRMFFRAAVSKSIDAVLHRRQFDTPQQFKAVGDMLPAVEQQTIVWPARPHIDPLRCNGCDACIRACPHDVFTLERDELSEKSARYTLNPSRCSGCTICTDICDQQAIHLTRWQPETIEAEQSAGVNGLSIPLASHTCDACGIRFHEPDHPIGAGLQKAPSEADQGVSRVDQKEDHLCRICRLKNHNSLLYQVLD